MLEEIYTDDQLSIIINYDTALKIPIVELQIKDSVCYRRIDQIKIIIEKLISWYISEIDKGQQGLPKLTVNSKEKIVRIRGISFLNDGNSLFFSAKSYERLQEMVLNTYYG